MQQIAFPAPPRLVAAVREQLAQAAALWYGGSTGASWRERLGKIAVRAPLRLMSDGLLRATLKGVLSPDVVACVRAVAAALQMRSRWPTAFRDERGKANTSPSAGARHRSRRGNKQRSKYKKINNKKASGGTRGMKLALSGGGGGGDGGGGGALASSIPTPRGVFESGGSRSGSRPMTPRTPRDDRDNGDSDGEHGGGWRGDVVADATHPQRIRQRAELGFNHAEAPVHHRIHSLPGSELAFVCVLIRALTGDGICLLYTSPSPRDRG